MKSGFFKLGDALFEHGELFFREGVFRRLRLGEMGERAYYLNVGALVKGVDDLLKLLSRPGSDPVQPVSILIWVFTVLPVWRLLWRESVPAPG